MYAAGATGSFATGTVTFGQDHTPGVVPTPEATSPKEATLASTEWWSLVEADWLEHAAALRAARVPLTTRSDAAGACDGIKDGKYGFHTGADLNPWWQVDLGEAIELHRVVVYNRLDYPPGLHNADPLQLLTSDEATPWTLQHDNQGRHFGGVSGGGPLEVEFPEGTVRARFVRLQVPSAQPLLFHLDEVEVYGRADPARNLALHQPADQSSLSVWSTVKRRPSDDMGPLFPTAQVVGQGRRLAEALAPDGAAAAVQPSVARLRPTAVREALHAGDLSGCLLESHALGVAARGRPLHVVRGHAGWVVPGAGRAWVGPESAVGPERGAGSGSCAWDGPLVGR